MDDAQREPDTYSFFGFFQASALHLDFDGKPAGFAGGFNGVCDAPGTPNVVVFEHDLTVAHGTRCNAQHTNITGRQHKQAPTHHCRQVVAVRGAASNQQRVLLNQAKPGRGFPGARDFASPPGGVRQLADGPGFRRDAGRTGDDVQRGAFPHEDVPRRPRHRGDLAHRLNGGALLYVPVHFASQLFEHSCGREGRGGGKETSADVTQCAGARPHPHPHGLTLEERPSRQHSLGLPQQHRSFTLV